MTEGKARRVTETQADMPIYYSPDYTLAGYAFDTTRKASWVADSLRHRPIEGVRLVEPRPLTADEVARVHAPEYVKAVRTGEPRHLAESQGFGWDPGLWPMVLASNGGAVAAALEVLRSGGVAGSLSSGLHHARRDRGDGFCTFNGLALAARAAQSAGAKRLLVIDLDAHCGGGTHQLLADDPAIKQLDVAVDSFDSYQPTRADWTLDLVDDAADYLPTIGRRLEARSAETAGVDLVLYNAGMDPFGESAVGGLHGITADILAERERLVFEWCLVSGLPVAFVLAGGYASGQAAQAELVELHRLTIEAAVASPG
jgi:acetoin utilization deacetylase AcuC-like enzyme